VTDDSGPPGRWRRVKEIVDRALDVDPEERAAFLASVCGGDEALRREVRSLVESAEKDWSLMDGGAGLALDGPPPSSRVGERIGPYELLSELGRGGMGQVFLARRADDEFQKRVAIKLLPPGPMRELARERFRSERQIAATLDHPNIARLLDGGTTAEGEPYFVMEYVEGESLIDDAGRRRLSVAQRLRLFREVCAAVHYAHQNLVVHRDIKPGNILVTAEGSPKLLDFGIAKLLGAEAELPPGETATLFRMLTPDYASPEQVRGKRVSTASDVYSLGVVLYELLCGERPYRIRTTDPEELVRLVCVEDPARPSTRAPGMSADLDAIVLKALRKEPERRYPSVDALSADIARHLDGRPVQARRGSAGYRLGKFVKRNRVAVAAAAVVLLALAGGIATTLAEARRARAAEARAERRFNDVRKLANSFLFEFHDAIRDLPGSTPARALVVRRALEYLDGLSRESRDDLSLRRELSEAYQKVGDVQGNAYTANLGDVPGALASYDKAVALLEPAVVSGKGGDAEKGTLASAYLVGGGIRLVAGDAKTAVAMAEKGLPLRRELAAKAAGDARRQMDLAQAYQFYAFFLSAAGRSRESSEALRAQTAILRDRLAREPNDRQARRSLSQNLYLTGNALEDSDRKGAVASYREAVRILESLRAGDPSSTQLRRDLGYAYTAVGNVSLTEKETSAAEESYRLALAVFEPLVSSDAKSADGKLAVAMTHHNLGNLAAKTDRPADALREYETARALYEPLVANDPNNAWAAGMLADLYLAVGRAEEKMDGRPTRACGSYRRADQAFRRLRASNRLHRERGANADEAARLAGRCANPGS
jgi:non-specific serine/threonine protein kinase/serine/threonine-protein kinase